MSIKILRVNQRDLGGRFAKIKKLQDLLVEINYTSSYPKSIGEFETIVNSTIWNSFLQGRVGICIEDQKIIDSVVEIVGAENVWCTDKSAEERKDVEVNITSESLAVSSLTLDDGAFYGALGDNFKFQEAPEDGGDKSNDVSHWMILPNNPIEKA